ncbi:unnamed protein product [Pleuronectes platessa]|uniref:Uncharacterized protein n=1 Tax=Pleuronectes platessa TaxID=8262 RepID=A0A9N7YMM8_PLEPL|nr:unnamed protein product [Pleuronectes platessa]
MMPHSEQSQVHQKLQQLSVSPQLPLPLNQPQCPHMRKEPLAFSASSSPQDFLIGNSLHLPERLTRAAAQLPWWWRRRGRTDRIIHRSRRPDIREAPDAGATVGLNTAAL